jgi:antitoxin VapB
MTFVLGQPRGRFSRAVALFRRPFCMFSLCLRPRNQLAIARIFRSGNSQAVWLPRPFPVNSKELRITCRRDEIVLREKPESLAKGFELLAGLPKDFPPKRGKDKPPKAASDRSALGARCTLIHLRLAVMPSARIVQLVAQNSREVQ